MKIFNLALILRLIPVSLWGIGYAPDSRMLMELSENFNYSHSLMYPMVLSLVGPAGAVSLQIILDSLTAVMIGSLSPIGGFLYAVSLGPVVYSNYVLTDTLATFFLTVALWGGMNEQGSKRNLNRVCWSVDRLDNWNYTNNITFIFLAGVLCAIFLREIALLLSPLFIFLWWYGAHGYTARQGSSG